MDCFVGVNCRGGVRNDCDDVGRGVAGSEGAEGDTGVAGSEGAEGDTGVAGSGIGENTGVGGSVGCILLTGC